MLKVLRLVGYFKANSCDHCFIVLPMLETTLDAYIEDATAEHHVQVNYPTPAPIDVGVPVGT